MSYQEFLAWEGENQHVEWVDGEVVPMAAVSDEHSLVTGFCLNLLQNYVATHRLGEVRFDPFQMKTGPKLPGRAPDVLFVANKHLGRLRKLYLDGPADLVIEVTSPNSRGLDRGVKYVEYEQGGVREYWLIDPERKQAEFYRLGRGGIYRLVPIGDDGVFRSSVVKGLWLKTAWLWQRPLPPPLSIFKEWGIL